MLLSLPKYASFSVLICLLFTGCMNNIEDISNGEIPNPDEVSFSNDIQPIISASCAGSGCHIPNTTNGVNLSSHSDILNSIGNQYGTLIVIPGNPGASPLMDKINPDPEFGQRMPLTGGYLTPAEIKKIEIWIANGAEDN